MFAPYKRLFAGKQNLHSEPFCPCLTTESGYESLKKTMRATLTQQGGIERRRHRFSDGAPNQ